MRYLLEDAPQRLAQVMLRRRRQAGPDLVGGEVDDCRRGRREGQIGQAEGQRELPAGPARR
jgi:hypothetical protein